MITLTILLIIIWATTCVVREAISRREWFLGIFVSVFIVLIGCLLGVALLILFSPCHEEVKRVDRQIEIISLRNEASISGYFALGSGQINGADYYFTFYKDEEGGVRRYIIRSDHARLFFINEKPCIKWKDIYYKTPWWVSFVGFEDSRETMKDIYIPEGSLIEKFEVR